MLQKRKLQEFTEEYIETFSVKYLIIIFDRINDFESHCEGKKINFCNVREFILSYSRINLLINSRQRLNGCPP